MNKYQDFHSRYNKTNSLSVLPSVKFTNPRLVDILKRTKKVSSLSLVSHHILSPIKDQKQKSLRINLEATIPKTPIFAAPDLPSQRKSISDLSEKQNAKILNNLPPIIQQNSRSFISSNQGPVFTEQEYKNLLCSINQVISPQGPDSIPELVEGSSQSLILSSGKIKYFKCNLKEKRVPLTIKIKRQKGRVCVYTSKEVHEPGPFSHEKHHTSDVIHIRDSKQRFSFENLYLGVHALEDSKLKIYVSFGKNIEEGEEIVKNKCEPISSVPEEDSIDEELMGNVKKRLSLKDFVGENKVSQFSFVEKKNSLLTERAKKWKFNRDKVLDKKKLFIVHKRKKALEWINRKNSKTEIRGTEKEMKDDKVTRIWISIIFLSKSILSIQECLKVNKQKNLGIA